MTVMQITRTSVAGSSPVSGSLQPGQLAIEMGTPTRLWVGVPVGLDPTMQKLLYDSTVLSTMSRQIEELRAQVAALTSRLNN